MQGTTFVPFLFAYHVVWGHWSHRSGWITARLKQKYHLPTTTVIVSGRSPRWQSPGMQCDSVQTGTRTVWKSITEPSQIGFWQSPKTFLKKPEKRSWQMRKGMIVYPSARESGNKKRHKPMKFGWNWWENRRIRPKSGAWKFLEKPRKKFLTNGGECGKITESAQGRRQRAVPCKLNNVKMTFITLDKNKVLIDN